MSKAALFVEVGPGDKEQHQELKMGIHTLDIVARFLPRDSIPNIFVIAVHPAFELEKLT